MVFLDEAHFSRTPQDTLSLFSHSHFHIFCSDAPQEFVVRGSFCAFSPRKAIDLFSCLRHSLYSSRKLPAGGFSVVVLCSVQRAFDLSRSRLFCVSTNGMRICWGSFARAFLPGRLVYCFVFLLILPPCYKLVAESAKRKAEIGNVISRGCHVNVMQTP
jgi:hypothetical protein